MTPSLATEMDNNKDNLKIDEDKEMLENKQTNYLVCFGIVIVFIAGIGHVNSFGLIYNDFMIETNSTAKSLTTAHGAFSVMLAIGGIILNSVSCIWSLRTAGIVGAILFIFGSFSTILITNVNQLPVTFGIFQGIGFGIMVPACYSTFNFFFVKRRTTVMSICKAVQGVILMWYPQLIKFVVSFYGFRGTLLIISGISLHTLPGMMIMRMPTVKRDKTANENKVNEGNRESDDLLNETDKNVTVCKSYNNESQIMNRIIKLMNLRIMKDLVYCNICVGQSFVNFSDLTFFILQPILLLQYNYSKTEVATCISICAGADVAGRFLLALLSSFITVNTRLLFYLATLSTFVMRLVMLQVREFVWMAIVTTLLGIFRAWLHVASPLVISHHVPHKDFPGAYALFMLCTGFVNIVFAPLIGLVKDEFDDYVPAFYALTLFCIPCLIFWPLEHALVKPLRKPKEDV